MKYDLEVTDTFGGEANYCWVKRETVEIPECGADKRKFRRLIAKAVRELAGWPSQSVRVRIEDHGDMLTVRPDGLLQVAFATYNDR